MPQDCPLHEDYLPDALRPLNAAAAIDGTIAVQAAQTVAQTDWLLELAGQPDAGILGVVGWAPLDEPDDTTIERLAADRRCVGVRPMLQDLAEDDWIKRRVRRQELERIAAGGLVLEVLSYPRQLPYALRAVESIDGLTVVIDHLSKPAYREPLGGWAEHMRAFAARPDTYCKLSGLVTEVGRSWSIEDVRRHADFVLEAFGPDRVLLGTDWPVCLLAASHAEAARRRARRARARGGVRRHGRARVWAADD
jgi:L-fuconolactonase